VVYLISGFRWSFYEIADVSVGVSVGMTLSFLALCMIAVWWNLQDRVPAEELTRESASFPAQARSACRRGALSATRNLDMAARDSGFALTRAPERRPYR